MNDTGHIKWKNAELKAFGHLEALKRDLLAASGHLKELPDWAPSAAFAARAEKSAEYIEGIEARLRKKLVVTIIGPTGSGKSTLLNALAGTDGLSPSGRERPTTRSVTVLCREPSDAGRIESHFNGLPVTIKTAYGAPFLEHMMIIDTPDTDSTLSPDHMESVLAAISVSDALILVFNGENPKSRDHVDFLSRHITRFSGNALIFVLNKCDRIDEQELKTAILPEFISFIDYAWERDLSGGGGPAKSLFCISGRRHLKRPDWDPKAGPKHDFDQFNDLVKALSGVFAGNGGMYDVRVENAKEIRKGFFADLEVEACKDAPYMISAAEKIKDTENDAVGCAAAAFNGDSKSSENKTMPGLQTALYRELAQRWIGPMGWVIAFWMRIMVIGTGIRSVMTLGRKETSGFLPVPVKTHVKKDAAPDGFTPAPVSRYVDRDMDIMASAANAYLDAWAKEWPVIHGMLTKGRFSVKKRPLADADKLTIDMSGAFGYALFTALDNAATSLSGIFMQTLFNLPITALLAYLGWHTVRSFLSGHYLSSDFFTHGIMTAVIVVMLEFFLFQLIQKGIYNHERIVKSAVMRLAEHLKTGKENCGKDEDGPMGSVLSQINAVCALAGKDIGKKGDK